MVSRLQSGQVRFIALYPRINERAGTASDGAHPRLLSLKLRKNLARTVAKSIIDRKNGDDAASVGRDSDSGWSEEVAGARDGTGGCILCMVCRMNMRGRRAMSCFARWRNSPRPEERGGRGCSTCSNNRALLEARAA